MFETLYQDTQIIVLNKAAGISVLVEGWDENAPYLKKALEEKFRRIWVVHRLDKVTSGVMVFALSPEAHRNLNTQFEQRRVVKSYHAIVENIPEWNEHTARHSLYANVGRKHRTVVDKHRGKPSETVFRVLARNQAENRAWIEANPKTGRTHQVRVHLSALGFPLLGDTLYGASPSKSIVRPALHARELHFTHPLSGEKMSFTASYPKDFEKLIENLFN